MDKARLQSPREHASNFINLALSADRVLVETKNAIGEYDVAVFQADGLIPAMIAEAYRRGRADMREAAARLVEEWFDVFMDGSGQEHQLSDLIKAIAALRDDKPEGE